MLNYFFIQGNRNKKIHAHMDDTLSVCGLNLANEQLEYKFRFTLGDVCEDCLGNESFDFNDHFFLEIKTIDKAVQKLKWMSLFNSLLDKKDIYTRDIFRKSKGEEGEVIFKKIMRGKTEPKDIILNQKVTLEGVEIALLEMKMIIFEELRWKRN